MVSRLVATLARIKGIKAVSFDGDGTLWDFEAVMRHSLRRVLSELRRLDPQAGPRASVDMMIEVRERVAEQLRGRTTNLEQVRLEAFRQTLRDLGRPDEDLALYLNQVYLRHRFEDIELFPDVLPTLVALRSKYTVGLLSNGNTYPERVGLGEMLDFVVFSQDHGVEKPDPRLFRVALREAHCAPKEMLHVGDSLGTDVLGAKRAGVKSVWLNRQGLGNETQIIPDYEIGSLAELPVIL